MQKKYNIALFVLLVLSSLALGLFAITARKTEYLIASLFLATTAGYLLHKYRL